MLTTCKREDMCSPAILTPVFMCLRRTPGTRFTITDGSDRRLLPELAGFSPHISDRRPLPELPGFSPHISDFHPMPELAGFSHRGRRYR
ncbi:BnaA10g28310D [Brassica napus]|uniref:BnaA10g28310D protein n=2 Tax=Brassica napus TaxID=3708 RepID=A0A078IF12_BRANA|nr:BnaA10g28310D [Brassica napus]